MKKRFICAIASLTLLFMSAANLSAAWKPGLYGGFVKGGANRDGYPAVSNVCNGPFAATNYVGDSKSSSTCPPIWATYRTWVYWGEVYLEKGKTCFAAKIDDWTYLKIDGKVYIDEAMWYTVDRSGLLDLETGWHAFEVRLGNTGGGAGPDGGIPVGFGIKNDGVDSAEIFDYTYPVDPMKGIPVLFRHDDGLGRSTGLAITGEPKEYGEAVPAYGVVEGLVPGQEVACSVPSEVELAPGEKAYPLGWSLYDVEPETGAKTLASSGSGRETTYASGEKDAQLVWQWAISNRVTIVASEGGTISSGSLWVADDASVPLVATAAEGYTFLGWTGDVPGADLLSASISLKVDRPMTISALFAPATASGTKTWKGTGDGLRWEDGANWEPAGVPTPADAVLIDAGKVLAETTVHAASIEIGSGGALWLGASNKVDQAVSLFPKEKKAYDLAVTGNIVCAGELVLGGKLMAGSCSYVVGGDLIFKKGARGAVHPVSVEHSFEEILRNEYTPVEIGGAFVLPKGATLYVHCDEITGSHLRFAMETATIDGMVQASSRGWNYFPKEELVPDVGPIFENHYGDGPIFCTHGYGPSGGWNGACHGGLGNQAEGPRARTYGNPYAPCLPGSPSGVVYNPRAGGGVIRMEARGLFALNGALVAQGEAAGATASSGGSIWVTAGRFQRGAGSRIDAMGDGAGGGGRVAIAEGLRPSDLAALEEGTLPDHVTASDYSRDGLVRGGNYGSDPATGEPLYAGSGSSFYLTRADAFVSVTISTDVTGIEALEPTPGWGTHSFSLSEPITLTSPLLATDPAAADRERYHCTGYTISNATKTVRSGTENEFLLPGDLQGPFWVTWHYGVREYRTTVTATAGGTLSGAGVVDGGVVDWRTLGSEVPAVEAIPDEGCEFLFWTGDVPAGLTKAKTLRLTTDRPRDLRAVFRKAEAPTVRTWNHKDAGDWLDPTKWEPQGNIPGFEDDVVVPAGLCFAPNHIECASLTIKGTGIVRLSSKYNNVYYPMSPIQDFAVAGAPDGLEEVSLVVPGDVVLSEAAQLAIGYRFQPWQVRVAIGGDLRLAGAGGQVVRFAPFAGAASKATSFDHATGAPFTVGGTFEIGPGAIFYPGSHSYWGASFAIRAREFRLLEGGLVDGNERGYGFDEKNFFCLAPGRGAWHGTSGGGYGCAAKGAGTDHGLAYGQEMAPVEPGSPNGCYNGGYLNRGGGLLRVHGERMTIAGTVKLCGGGNTFGGSSGGGLWLTARWIDFGPKAVLNVAGGLGGYTDETSGGGGRIAIVRGLSAEAVDHLAQTGELPAGMEKRVQRAESFFADHPTMTLDLRRGDKAEGCDGTFAYLDGVPQGTMLLLR